MQTKNNEKSDAKKKSHKTITRIEKHNEIK
jgi:hypothetical protein